MAVDNALDNVRAKLTGTPVPITGVRIEGPSNVQKSGPGVVVDKEGNVVENLTEEKLVCKDGASDFLFNMGIAENCEMYTWDMPVGEVIITQRQIACKKMDGTGYEIVQGYHSID